MPTFGKRKALAKVAALWQARRDGRLSLEEFPDDDKIVATYRKGVAKGILKVMGKMGISTLHSYKGAQIFEAVGLRDEVIERTGKIHRRRVYGNDVCFREHHLY